MEYEVSTLIESVRVMLDENKASSPSMEEVGTLSIDDIIVSHLPHSVARIVQFAPVQYLEGAEDFKSAVVWDANTMCVKGSVRVPDDYLRLVSFRMSDWNRSVNHTEDEFAPVQQMRCSKFSGIRHMHQDPLLVLTWKDGVRALEFYGSRTTKATLEEALYYPVPRIVSDKIHIPQRLLDASLNECAFRTANALQMPQANVFREISKDIIYDRNQ